MSMSGCEIQKVIEELGYEDIVSIGDNDELLKHYSDDELIDQIVNNNDRDIEAIIKALQDSSFQLDVPMSIKYRVWNQTKTEYFETIDYQLAYEVRKGSDTNCHSEEESREKCQEGVEFIYKWIHDSCTIEEVIE